MTALQAAAVVAAMLATGLAAWRIAQMKGRAGGNPATPWAGGAGTAAAMVVVALANWGDPGAPLLAVIWWMTAVVAGLGWWQVRSQGRRQR